MRKLLVPIILGVAIVSFTGCNPLKKMQKNMNLVKVQTEDEILEVHADSVNVFFNTAIPPKFFKKRAIMKIEPVYVYSKDSVYLDPLLIAGEKVDVEANKIDPKNVIKYETGGTVEYRKRLAYDPAMKNSAIYIVTSYKIDSEYDELDQCICDIKKDKISDGIIATSQTVKRTDDVLLAGSFAAERIAAQATIYYDCAKFDVKKTEVAKPEVGTLTNLVLDQKYTIDGLKLNSSASPDGTLDLNTKLAADRKSASYKFVVQELKKLGFTAVYDSAFYKKDAVSEDWTGLKTLVDKSDLTIRQDILKIADSDLPLDEKEAAIRKLGQWDYLAKNILPQLRKSEIYLTGETKIRPLDVLNRLYAQNKLDSLYNRQELLYLAFNQTDLDKQMELFQRYNKMYPDGYAPQNNIAYVHILKGQYDQALDILKPLNTKYPNQKEILNNMGVCYRMTHMYDTALYYYDLAEKAGAAEKNNKGIVYIKKGQYDMSVQTFETKRYDYNRALAYTLKKDFEGAKQVIEGIEEKSADDFYLRAIIGARTKDMDLMTTSLTRAIKLDPSIRERAKTDYEFFKYWNSAEFLNAIK